ncbi:unnamed protein product [Brassica oleracea var. botrytis]
MFTFKWNMLMPGWVLYVVRSITLCTSEACKRFELELVQYNKRGFGRKRILVSSLADEIEDSFFIGKISSKKLSDGQSQELEDLPLDILANLIVPGVLLQALIAKQSQVAYSTPRKTSVFHHDLNKQFGLGVVNVDEIKAQRAPVQTRYRIFADKPQQGRFWSLCCSVQLNQAIINSVSSTSLTEGKGF